jgi:CheY-like chemotaxis protein
MQTPQAPRHIRKVLLIDDRLDAILPIRLLLKRDGHEIFEANNGEDGVALAASVQPDVVLCDIGLPGKWDGFDVIRQLRLQIETKTAYMIAVSGYCQPSDVERSRQAGFDDHFAKPVDIVKLRQLIAEHPLQSNAALHDVLTANTTSHQADDK